MRRKRTFSYNDFPDWEPHMWQLLSKHISKSAIDIFKNTPPDPECRVSDELRWLDDIIEQAGGAGSDIKQALTDEIETNYSYLRGYHATNTPNTQPYYRNGIRVLDPGVASKNAFDFFRRNIGPEKSDDEIHAAIPSLSTTQRASRIFFGLEYEFLVHECGHYLVYGSEYLLGIAATLSNPNGPDYRLLLQNLGKPTVFVCDVPIADIQIETIRNLAGLILVVLFERVLHPTYQIGPENFGFYINFPLPARLIRRHIHPTQVRDPITKQAFHYKNGA